MATKTPRKRRRPASSKKEKIFVVRIARDLSEYADVAVITTDTGRAEEIVSDLLHDSSLPDLEYEAGDDREGPYTCDSWESDGADQVACIIKNGAPVLTPPPSKLICPYCQYRGDNPTEHGTGFRYLADATTWRQIIGIEQTKTERGSTLAILSPYENYEEDEEKNERIECRACLREFPIPAGLGTDFR